MTTDPDDALRWEGDEPEAPNAPAANTPPAAAPPASGEAVHHDVPPAATPREAPTGAAASAPSAGDSAEQEEPVGAGNAALVFYGIIGGVYLLFAAGWIVGGFRLRPRASLLLGDWTYFPWMWLAALAPVLWFAATWALTRGRASWIRIVALIAGAALLVPWPFVMFGTVGA
ncbi:conserved membrane hypothetical protein [Microbacterium sp. 8M]|jgi:hypothetical protein|uniref:hypothetical protein n=1 Tax=Microbacterium sp. 8M TaxID=2653153 RepID=UPI0012F0374D|nr:hypothetical protein [Microbacterium sp. 8M]VXB00881.1 conserved membrane hypothetical protein [Microbacterium sp. 8M]